MRVERRLPLTSQYSVVSIHQGTLEDNATVCYNCDRIIANVAVIKNEDGNMYEVGLDCADTLTMVNVDQYEQMKYIYKKVARFVGIYKKEIENPSSYVARTGNELLIVYKDKKGKQKRTSIFCLHLKKYAKEVYDKHFSE